MPSPYLSRKNPDFLARASWNDYYGRRIYMVTITAAKGAPRFSRIEGNIGPQGAEARAVPTPVGEIIASRVSALQVRYPFADILSSVVMPDHIHFVIFVKEKTNIDLGHIVGSLKQLSDKEIQKAFPDLPVLRESGSVFTKGFNDRIVYKEGQLNNFNRYVADNPRRLYLKQTRPEFFHKRITLLINGKEYNAFGNFLLLRHCLTSAVRLSRTFSEEETRRRYSEWEEVMRGRGVLVSPFISKPEKAVRDKGLEAGASVIHIVPDGLPERFKPSDRDFNLCAEGRLLIVAPTETSCRRQTVSRETCLAMNRLAEEIAAGELALSVRGAGL